MTGDDAVTREEVARRLEGAVPPPAEAVCGRTPVPEGDDTGATGGGDLRASLVAAITAQDYDRAYWVPTAYHAGQIADRLMAAGWVKAPGPRLADALDLLDRYSQDVMGGTPDLFAPDCGHPDQGEPDHDPWDCMEEQVAALRGGAQ